MKIFLTAHSQRQLGLVIGSDTLSLVAPPRSDTIFAHRNFEKIASVSLQSVAPFFPFRVIQHSWEPYIVRPFFSFCWSQNFIYGRLPTLAPLRTSAYGDPKLIL